MSSYARPVVPTAGNEVDTVVGAFTAGALEVALESDLQKLRRFSRIFAGWESSDA